MSQLITLTNVSSGDKLRHDAQIKERESGRGCGGVEGRGGEGLEMQSDLTMFTALSKRNLQKDKHCLGRSHRSECHNVLQYLLIRRVSKSY